MNKSNETELVETKEQREEEIISKPEMAATKERTADEVIEKSKTVATKELRGVSEKKRGDGS